MQYALVRLLEWVNTQGSNNLDSGIIEKMLRYINKNTYQMIWYKQEIIMLWHGRLASIGDRKKQREDQLRQFEMLRKKRNERSKLM